MISCFSGVKDFEVKVWLASFDEYKHLEILIGQMKGIVLSGV